MLQDAGIDIDEDTLHHDGAFIRELGIIVVRWKDPRYDISDEIAIARMSKTIVHESVHSDGYTSGRSQSQDKLGYVDPTQNSGWYLEEGICEYLGREYLSRTTPASWFPHMDEILSTPAVSSRYIQVPGGRISSATDNVVLKPKNEHDLSLNARAIFLTADRLNDPYVTDSSLAAIGIDTLINGSNLPLHLFIDARKSPQSYKELQEMTDAIEGGLFDKLLLTGKQRASFWDTTLTIQRKLAGRNPDL